MTTLDSSPAGVLRQVVRLPSVRLKHGLVQDVHVFARRPPWTPGPQGRNQPDAVAVGLAQLLDG